MARRNARSPLGAVLTIFFIAPAWILGHLLPAGTDTSWALYDDHFQRWLLTPLIVLMAVRLVLLAAAALKSGGARGPETLRFGLWVCFVALLYWVVFSGRIFAHVITDALFKAWLLIFLLVNTIQIVVWIRRVATRVRIPKTLASPLNKNSRGPSADGTNGNLGAQKQTHNCAERLRLTRRSESFPEYRCYRSA